MGLMEKLQKMWNPPEDEYDDYVDEEEQEDQQPAQQAAQPSAHTYYDPPKAQRSAPRQSAAAASPAQNRVVNLQSASQLKVALYKPTTFGEETRGIADELIGRHTVVLNLEVTEREIARRIIDFLSGVAYANNGKIKRIATNTFIITPNNVDFSGDLMMDEIGSTSEEIFE